MMKIGVRRKHELIEKCYSKVSLLYLEYCVMHLFLFFFSVLFRCFHISFTIHTSSSIVVLWSVDFMAKLRHLSCSCLWMQQNQPWLPFWHHLSVRFSYAPVTLSVSLWAFHLTQFCCLFDQTKPCFWTYAITFPGVTNRWNRWSIKIDINRWQSISINRLILIIIYWYWYWHRLPSIVIDYHNAVLYSLNMKIRHIYFVKHDFLTATELAENN